MKSTFRAVLASSLLSVTALSGCSLIPGLAGRQATADPDTQSLRPTGYVYSTLYSKNKVLEINNVQSRVDNDPIDVPNGPRSLVMDPRDRNLYMYVVCELGNTVAVVDRRNRLVNRTIAVGNAPYDMAITPNGTRGFVTNQNDDTVSVIDIASNQVIQTLYLKNPVVNTGANPATQPSTNPQPTALKPRGIATNADGTRVYVACAGGYLAVLQGTPPTSTAASASAAANATAPANSNSGLYSVAPGRQLVGSVAPLNVAVARPANAPGDLIYVTDPTANALFFINGATMEVSPARQIAGAPYDVTVANSVTTHAPQAVYVSLEQKNAVQGFTVGDLSPVGEAVRVDAQQPQSIVAAPLGTEIFVSVAGSNNVAVFGRTGTTLNLPQVFNLQQLNPAYIAPTGDVALGSFLQ